MSGIRPTGFLHLGNYFGALQNYVRMQDEYDCYFMVADWHSLTTHPDTKELRSSVLRVLAENIAAGIDPDVFCLSNLFCGRGYPVSAVDPAADWHGLLEHSADSAQLHENCS